MGYFIFGGEHSRRHGVVISGAGTYAMPERDVSNVHVPGRNGDLIIDNGCWLNTHLMLPASVARGWAGKDVELRSWLGQRMGAYYRLETSYHPDEYRLARFLGPLEVDTGFLCRSASFDLNFDCKPQRWLLSGEAAIKLTTSGIILNPTDFEALPLIRVTCNGSGTLTVAGNTISLTGIDGSVTLDCELQEAYSGLASANAKVSGFPVLPGGDCAISWTGAVSAVEITPRWWRL